MWSPFHDFKTNLFVENLEVFLLIVEHLFVQFGIPSVWVGHGSKGIVERAVEVRGLGAYPTLRCSDRGISRDILSTEERWIIMVEEKAKRATIREWDSQVFDLKWGMRRFGIASCIKKNRVDISDRLHTDTAVTDVNSEKKRFESFSLTSTP